MVMNKLKCLSAEEVEKLKEQNRMLREKTKKFEGNFRTELRNSLKTAIIAAFSLLIALQWKELITELVNKITSISPVQGTAITTAIITVVCVLGIVLTTEFLSIKKED